MNPRNLGNYELFLEEIQLAYGSKIQELTRDELVNGNLRTIGLEKNLEIDESHALKNAMERAEFDCKKI